MPEPPPDKPNLRPLYALVILAIALCAFFFWIGTVCVRLWFYKGALGPEPEKFVVLKKMDTSGRSAPMANLDEQQQGSHGERSARRRTVSPQAAMLTPGLPSNTALSTALNPAGFSTLPTINIRDVDVDNLEEISDPTLRHQIAEEVRISRLPTFVQDDCGDGSEFPDVPIALEPVEEEDNTRQPLGLEGTENYLRLGLKKVDRSDWLTVDNKYIEQHEVRKAILNKRRVECVSIDPDGEDACEELLEEVAAFLTDKYPNHFIICTKDRRKYVRNEMTQEEYCLVRPFDRHPLEVCARLAMEDFHVLIKGEFTRKWYLQASASVLPAGWRMLAHIGKSLDAITGYPNEPMPLWEVFPSILKLPDLSPYSLAPALLTRRTTFIQTHPPNRSLESLLHIQRPVDFFAGTMSNLRPRDLIVRREFHTFRRLPKTGAVVLTTRTTTQRLTQMGSSDCRELLAEVMAWEEDEARFKGRDLWLTAVEGWCWGFPVLREDATVFRQGVEGEK